MYIYPPLRYTNVNLSQTKACAQFIKVQYGGEEAWKRVQAVFEQIDSLRQNLDFKQLNEQTPSNPKLSEETQKVIYDYYKYVVELERRFEAYSKPGQGLQIQFAWADSFNPSQEIVYSSSQFELIGLLYNLGAAFIVDGLNHYNGKNFLQAVKRFNGALGCYNEIQKQKSSIDPSVIGGQFDLCIDNLEILEHLSLGVGYGAYFEMKEPEEKTVGLDKIACIAGEAATNFGYAFSVLAKYLKQKQSPFPSAYQEKLKVFLQYFTSYYIAKAALKMHSFRVARIMTDTAGKNMGWAISYLEKGFTSINGFLNNRASMDALPQNYRETIQALGKQVNTAWAVCKQKNEEIYREPIIPTEQLPAMGLEKEWQILTGPLPSQLAEKIEEESAFTIFLPTELLSLVHEAKGVSNSRKNDLDLAYRSLYQKRNADFNNAHVQFFIDIWKDKANKSARQVTPFIQERIAQFMRNGGAERLQQLCLALKDNSKNCLMILAGIKQQLDDEAQDDADMKKGYGEQWNRMPSASINIEYMNDFARLDQAAKHAQQSDLAGFETYQKSRDVLQIPYLPESEILKRMPESPNEQILKVASTELEKLLALETQTDNSLKEIHATIGQIYVFIDNYNYALSVGQAAKKGIPTTDIVPHVLQPIKLQIEQFNQMVENTTQLIGDTCAMAFAVDDLRKKKTSNTQAIAEVDKIGKSLDEVCNLFMQFQEGLNFYQKLFDKSINLDQRVTDFLLARSFEKNNLAQQISYALSKEQNKNIGFGNIPQAPSSQPVYNNNEGGYYGSQGGAPGYAPPPAYGSPPPAPPSAPNPYNVPNYNQYGGAPPAYGYGAPPGVYYPPPAYGNPPK